MGLHVWVFLSARLVRNSHLSLWVRYNYIKAIQTGAVLFYFWIEPLWGSTINVWLGAWSNSSLVIRLDLDLNPLAKVLGQWMLAKNKHVRQYALFAAALSNISSITNELNDWCMWKVSVRDNHQPPLQLFSAPICTVALFLLFSCRFSCPPCNFTI